MTLSGSEERSGVIARGDKGTSGDSTSDTRRMRKFFPE